MLNRSFGQLGFFLQKITSNYYSLTRGFDLDRSQMFSTCTHLKSMCIVKIQYIDKFLK